MCSRFFPNQNWISGIVVLAGDEGCSVIPKENAEELHVAQSASVPEAQMNASVTVSDVFRTGSDSGGSSKSGHGTKSSHDEEKEQSQNGIDKQPGRNSNRESKSRSHILQVTRSSGAFSARSETENPQLICKEKKYG